MLCSRKKVKGISEVASGTPYSKKMAFKQGQESPNPRVEMRGVGLWGFHASMHA